MLWLAGLMILGHSTIPHHHHDIEKHHCSTEHHQPHSDSKTCSHENSVQKNELNSISSSECVCKHEHNNDNICHLFNRTLIQKADILTAAIIIQVFTLDKNNEQKIAFPPQNDLIKEIHLVGKVRGRAPPIA